MARLKRSLSKKIKVCSAPHYVAVLSLQYHPENSNLRSISRERLNDLKASIVSKGVYQPFIVNEHKQEVLSGNHRLKAILELLDEGYELEGEGLPVVYFSGSEAVARQILHESNLQYADWIETRVIEAMREAEKAGEDLKRFGYSEGEVEAFVHVMQEKVEGELKRLERKERAKELEAQDVEQQFAGTDDVVFYDSLTLPRKVYERLTSILSKISRQGNAQWREGDSIIPAIEFLCDLFEEREGREEGKARRRRV